jgi:hypothetical protein
MRNTIAQSLSIVGSGNDKKALQDILQHVGGALSTCALSTAGLAISATTTKVKTGAAVFYAMVRGRLLSIAAATDMPVLVGTVTNAKFNVFAFYVNGSGTVSSAMGTEGSALGSVIFPDLPLDQALIGFVIVNPTGTGNFVGGTTALSDGTVVPNAVYVSPIGACNPTILYS